MYPILRVQKVMDNKGKAKVTIPRAVQEKWGFPRYVLVKYDEKEDKLIIEPYKGGK